MHGVAAYRNKIYARAVDRGADGKILQFHGRRAGVVRQPLGLGRRPFRAFVQVITRAGAYSEIAPVRLR
jgi:hypothetical protein